MNHKLATNKRTWDKVAAKFHGVCALPEWGPFAVEKNDRTLIGAIKGKTFLEIGCGSGHSIAYLISHGAKKVYGLDISHAQIEAARDTNRKAVDSGRVELFECPMEATIDIAPVDVVFSIYAVGWTTDPARLFQNVRSYLKPKGTFVWSAGHTMFDDVAFRQGRLVVTRSYHDERITIGGWGKGKETYLTSRKISTWFKLLTENGFRVLEYLEPQPFHVPRNYDKDPTRYFSIIKANQLPCTMIWKCERT